MIHITLGARAHVLVLRCGSWTDQYAPFRVLKRSFSCIGPQRRGRRDRCLLRQGTHACCTLLQVAGIAATQNGAWRSTDPTQLRANTSNPLTQAADSVDSSAIAFFALEALLRLIAARKRILGAQFLGECAGVRCFVVSWGGRIRTYYQPNNTERNTPSWSNNTTDRTANNASRGRPHAPPAACCISSVQQLVAFLQYSVVRVCV